MNEPEKTEKNVTMPYAIRRKPSGVFIVYDTKTQEVKRTHLTRPKAETHLRNLLATKKE